MTLGLDYEQLNISSAKDLEELLKTPIFHGRFDPLERILYVEAELEVH